MNILKAFQKKQQTQQIKNYSPIVPSGLIAHTESGYFYIKNNKKFTFVSDRAMLSWNLPVIKTKDSIMSSKIKSGVLGFRDGTLVKDISDGKIYLISDSKRRHIIDPDVLEWLNTDIIQIGQKELFVHSEGEKL
jgi:hypothetical protein